MRESIRYRLRDDDRAPEPRAGREHRPLRSHDVVPREPVGEGEPRAHGDALLTVVTGEIEVPAALDS